MQCKQTCLPGHCNRVLLGTYLSVELSRCDQLLGLDFELGATGEEGKIDCIQLVYQALKILEIPTPDFEQRWYECSHFSRLRSLRKWGERVREPFYNGDVILHKQAQPAFGVIWAHGAICINQQTQKVQWCQLAALQDLRIFRYCPTSAN